jgi:hypothetical protein
MRTCYFILKFALFSLTISPIVKVFSIQWHLYVQLHYRVNRVKNKIYEISINSVCNDGLGLHLYRYILSLAVF